MNRFLTRKKDKTVDDNASSGKKTKKGKKAHEEPKPELNFESALPSTDDFRTSLIMPGLSTRFSMLREQDDPKSLLGKASDDSVLNPKRQSRLHDFGFQPGGLSDIAEVSSLSGSVRPPFANERTNSFDSSMTDDGNGGMMSRARPGEGNVLFGGRQKIYKINKQSSNNNMGRLVYEDDVHLSQFQRKRLQEKEERLRQEEEQRNGLQLEPGSPTKDAMYSPSVDNFSQRRGTSSSTNSGTVNTRTSTAATSIASQGANAVSASSPAFPSSATPTSPSDLARSTTKKRLYDQGLEQHNLEQQSAALNRLNSIQRTRAPTGRSTPPLLFSQTRSATNLNDRFNRTAALRTESPTPGHPGMLNRMDSQSGGSSPIISRPQSPPLSPLASDSEEAQTLNSALNANDRGKATAMGAFNKPKQAFSEQQYAERLRRMQSERTTRAPIPENSQKPSPEPIRNPTPENPSKLSLRERAELEKRKRSETGEGERQRPGPNDEPKQGPSAFSMFQSAASQMRGPVYEAAHRQPEALSNLQSPDSQQGQTFFASPGSSDDEEAPKPTTITKPSELGRRLDNLPVATGPAPSILEHPALRSRSNSRPDDQSEHSALRSRSNSRLQPKENRPAGQERPANNDGDPDVDSPTLGPNSGLSGLVRQHLRNVSNVSSDYGDSGAHPPATAPAGLALQTNNVGYQRRQPVSENDTPAHSSYSHSNPWDLDDLDNPYHDERGSVSSVSPVDAQKSKPQPAAFAFSPIEEGSRFSREMKKKHTREYSETHEEHEAFQRDIAERQRLIQENLRARAEGRSTSPAPSSQGGLKNALNLLRAKSSRESFATVERQPEAPTKAMKMLGIGANSGNASSTSLAGRFSDEHWRPEMPNLRQKPSRVLQQSEQDAQREFATRQRSATGDSNRDARSKARTPPASSQSSIRGRSSSEVSSGRSRSRPGYRDDLEQAMAEGRSSMYPQNKTPSIPGYTANPTQPFSSERPSLEQQHRMRSRSNSRTATSNHFESKHLQPIHTGNGPANGSSPRLSPSGSPMPPSPPGLPVSPRPSPGGQSAPPSRPQASPVHLYSATNTPPVSNPNPPAGPGFNANAAQQHQPLARNGPLRKKSVAKTDISEPVFLSTTSVMDTVNLPAGASLKNGAEPTSAPPVPPINPRRRRFGFGRTESPSPSQPSHDPAIHAGLGASGAPFAESMRTNSSDALSSQAQVPKQRLRKVSSEGKSLHGRTHMQEGASPAVPSNGFQGRNYSPPRPLNDRPMAQHNMDGAMF